MEQNSADVTLNISRNELAILDAIFTFEEDSDSDEDEGTWKAELSDKALNGIDEEDMDITDAEDLVDQLKVKISHLAALASV